MSHINASWPLGEFMIDLYIHNRCKRHIAQAANYIVATWVNFFTVPLASMTLIRQQRLTIN